MQRALFFVLFFLLTGCAPSHKADLKLLSWRETVGPALMWTPVVASPSLDRSGRLIVVNWNIQVGNGNIPKLIETISREEKAKGFAQPEFVLLLQEAFRQGEEVPSPGRTKVPRRIAPPNSRMEIEEVARELGWWMYYAPSMRNGRQVGHEAEDRGNAILSSLPLKDIEAVELPFVVQRRVALIATVTDSDKNPKLRVVVTHLDTQAPLLKGWFLGGPAGRKQQAEGIVAALKKFNTDELPLVVGGDFNTHFGSGESAVETISRVAARTDCGREATHVSGLTLDHVFTRLPETWLAPKCTRINDTFGSDHYPLVLPLDIAG